MNTKTAPSLSISRRSFIASAAGNVVSGLAEASPLSLLSTLNQGGVDLPAPAPKHLHLDLAETKLHLNASLYTLLQILTVSVFEKKPNFMRLAA